MSILTGRDLQFLASLRTDWRRHYLSEVARLLKEDDRACDARYQDNPIAPAIQTLERLHSELGGKILKALMRASKRCGASYH